MIATARSVASERTQSLINLPSLCLRRRNRPRLRCCSRCRYQIILKVLWYQKLIVKLTFSQCCNGTIYYENANSIRHLNHTRTLYYWLHAQEFSLYTFSTWKMPWFSDFREFLAACAANAAPTAVAKNASNPKPPPRRCGPHPPPHAHSTRLCSHTRFMLTYTQTQTPTSTHTHVIGAYRIYNYNSWLTTESRGHVSPSHG